MTTAPGATPEIRIAALTKRFGDVVAVDGISLDIGSGEFFSLLGPSGCGKTTTLRMIGGFEQPTDGRVLLRGRDVTDDPPDKRPVNMVFQNYALFPHLDVGDNIAFGLKRQKVAGGRDRSPHRRGARAGPPLGLREAQAEPALGRPAAARRPGAGARQSAERAAARRAAGRARPQAPQAPPARAQAHPGRGRHHLRLRDPRPGGGAHDERPDRGHARRSRRAAGHPEELYERPATRFVADFIGTTNLLHGTVDAVEPGGAVVRLDWGDRCVSSRGPGRRAGGRHQPAARRRSILPPPSGDATASARAVARHHRAVRVPGRRSSTRSARPAGSCSRSWHQDRGPPARRRATCDVTGTPVLGHSTCRPADRHRRGWTPRGHGGRRMTAPYDGSSIDLERELVRYMAERRVTRRQLLERMGAVGVTAALAPVLAACTGGGASSPRRSAATAAAPRRRGRPTARAPRRRRCRRPRASSSSTTTPSTWTRRSSSSSRRSTASRSPRPTSTPTTSCIRGSGGQHGLRPDLPDRHDVPGARRAAGSCRSTCRSSRTSRTSPPSG